MVCPTSHIHHALINPVSRPGDIAQLGVSDASLAAGATAPAPAAPRRPTPLPTPPRPPARRRRPASGRTSSCASTPLPRRGPGPTGARVLVRTFDEQGHVVQRRFFFSCRNAPPPPDVSPRHHFWQVTCHCSIDAGFSLFSF